MLLETGIRNAVNFKRKRWKTDSAWLGSFVKRRVENRTRQVATLSGLHVKIEMAGFRVGRFQTSKNH
jgi:hypothetical protein